jgi:hypothetical protein
MTAIRHECYLGPRSNESPSRERRRPAAARGVGRAPSCSIGTHLRGERGLDLLAEHTQIRLVLKKTRWRSGFRIRRRGLSLA